MFVDKAKIFVQAGKGGNGCVSFRREKYVPYGGPDGGNGGDGGSVYIRANPNISTLYDFLLKPYYKAQDGQDGKSNNMHGKNGKDLYIDVPCGCLIYKILDKENKIFLKDLKLPGEYVLVAKGGEGGKGNSAFKSSTNRAPRIAELGLPGEKVEIFIELKLIADVGIIGLPNVGKSTLLSVLTSAKPKIADYPFTTLSPNLGVCFFGDFKFVLADIPGLIENAHQGKGLGIEFLRHIERTKILLHMIDVSVKNPQICLKNYKIIKNELTKYSKFLAKKPTIIVLNKIDMISQKDVKKIFVYFQKKLKISKNLITTISLVKKQNIELLIKKIINLLNKAKNNYFSKEEKKFNEQNFVYEKIIVEKKDNKFIVKGKTVEDVVNRTNFSLKESVEKLQKMFKKIGLEKILKNHGIKHGDKVIIANKEFDYYED